MVSCLIILGQSFVGPQIYVVSSTKTEHLTFFIRKDFQSFYLPNFHTFILLFTEFWFERMYISYDYKLLFFCEVTKNESYAIILRTKSVSNFL